ncbi:disulfide bond formation protein B [Pseudomonas sp. NY15364]|uniref:disulfide bond formation protein B n=1 Tax=unclassified Pseudomonas TaxID=196821 RepID=UPI000F79600B|nr:disulfide bond formation protein B [Pseudomonas sp. o96-267]RRV24349.1 disulfide bond formation protein B [Pseudomonas sp. o96-267]
MSTTHQSPAWTPLLLAWLLALFATLAALFIGEVMGQAPCVLCWFQRICMFPLALILAVACYRADFAVWHYALPLSVTGGLIALGHSLLYFDIIPQRIQPCSASGPSCTDANMAILGLPLPLLALATFALITILLLIVRRRTPQ